MAVGSAPEGRTGARGYRGVGHGRRHGLLPAEPAPGGNVSCMAELKDRLRADLTSAMKSQDKLRTATLRMLLAAIQTEEVSGKQSRELSDDDVLKVLAREAKKRGESAEIYTQNGRGELAANEHAEAQVIDEYLPTPLTEAELADVVDTAIAAGRRGDRRAARDEADGPGDEGGDGDRRGQGRRRPALGRGQGPAVAVFAAGTRVTERHDAFWLHPDDRTERTQRACRLCRFGGTCRLRLRGVQRPLLPVALVAGPRAVRVVGARRGRARHRAGRVVHLRHLPDDPLPPRRRRAEGGHPADPGRRSVHPRRRQRREPQRACRRQRLADRDAPTADAQRGDSDHARAVHRRTGRLEGRVLRSRLGPALGRPGHRRSRSRRQCQETARSRRSLRWPTT